MNIITKKYITLFFLLVGFTFVVPEVSLANTVLVNENMVNHQFDDTVGMDALQEKNDELNQRVGFYKENLEIELQELAEELNVTIGELEDLKRESPDFDAVIESALRDKEWADKFSQMDTSDSFVNTNKVEPYTTMGSVGIGMIRQYLRSGDIHITPINKNNGVRHGHAVLAYNASYNIEIHGEGTVSSLSPNVGWGDYSAYRLYRAKVSDYSAAKVASYGRNYLLNIPYKGLASVLNNDEVNCVSLGLESV